MKKKLLSVCLAAAMAVTMTPWTALQGAVYAADDPAGVVTEQETEEAAAEQLAACKLRVSQAQTVWEQKKEAYLAAKEESEAADQAYRDKKAVSDQADQALADAQQAAEAAAAALEDAETNKDAAEAGLGSAQQDLAAAQAAKEAADAAVVSAQSELSGANSQWQGEQMEAEEDLENAQRALDTAGTRFLDEKAGTNYSSSAWYSWIKENMRNYSIGNQSFSWGDYLDSDAFDDAYYSPYSYEKLMEAADLVAEGNLLRKSQDSSLPDLKIDYKMMTLSIASNSMSSNEIGHLMFNLFGDSSQNFRNEPIFRDTVANGWGENLAWGAPDPFMGWYYEEKIHYIADQIAKYQPNVTMAMIDQVETEAEQNGHDFAAYYNTYYWDKEDFLNDLNSKREKSSSSKAYYSTGHYTNLIKSDWTITGLSVNAKGTLYGGVCQEQCFSTKSTSEAVTPQAFKAALAAFAQEDIDRVAAAEATVEALKTAPSYVTQAEADLQDAQDTATQAAQDVTNAQTAVTNAEQVLANAQQALTQKQTENSEAQSALTAAQTAAQSANQETAAAEQNASDKELAMQEAESAFSEADGALNAAQQDEERAQAIYDAFFKLENASAEAIEDQTYTGSAVEPEVVIWNKGHTKKLTSDDYSLTYDKNVNVGTATVTAEGKDKYSGSLEQTFKIAAADIADAEIAAMDPEINTGQELTPEPELTFNGASLKAGVDYEITGYENNVEIGSATINIEGKGNFTGTTTCSFEIIENDGGYSQLPETEKKTVDSIMSKLQLNTVEAMDVYNFAKEAGVPADTLLVTDEAILKGNTDSDVKGSHFSPLTAKAAKTAKTSITIKWTKNAKADGYKIYGNLCGKTKKAKLLKTIKTNGTTSFTQKKLKKGKYYKYIVVAYKDVDGKQITVAASPTIHAVTAGGKAGNDKKVTTKAKKNKVTVKTGKTFKLGAKAIPVKAKNKVKKHRAVSYDSANKAIATVSAKGVIKGVKKGTCYVYAYAQNGVFAKIKVTVK